jgi:lipoprotein-anchoring transpeptidase ErfK/SrfK
LRTSLIMRWNKIIGLCVVAWLASGLGHAEDVPVALDPQMTALIQNAVAFKTGGDLLKSRETYRDVLSQYPDAPNIKDTERQVWDLNVAIIFSALQTHQTEIYIVEPGDTLKKIAVKFGTTIELIKRRNHMETTRIKPGQKLSVWLGSFTIFIDKSDNTLTLKNGEEVIKVYPVSTGRNDSSPVGKFTIKHRYTDPVWFHKGEVVEANSPKNYLGTRWLGFDLPKYGIHGTIEPERIGQQVSSGCIRMRNQDVQELYEMVPAGTIVNIGE